MLEYALADPNRIRAGLARTELETDIRELCEQRLLRMES